MRDWLAYQQTVQIYAWHAEDRFLFITAAGGTHDLVKEQPIARSALETIRRDYRSLAESSRTKRIQTTRTMATGIPAGGMRALGDFVSRLVVHPDIRRFLTEARYASVAVSTNEFSIPWEIMSFGAQPLGLLYPVSRRLQISRPMTAARIRVRDVPRIVIVGDPTSDLPGARTEARAIASMLESHGASYDVRTLIGAECTLRSVLAALAEADVFHFAGHGYFNRERPKESGLLLSDGPLLASELENFLGATGPVLAFLNACDSGAFGDADQALSGVAMASIAHPFIAAGSGGVVCASLPVDDEGAASFASTLYQNLFEGESLGMSVLRARQATARLFGADDVTWASFLCFGDDQLRLVVGLHWTREALQHALAGAAAWLRAERLATGSWCDRVYRAQAPMNCAEVALAMNAAGVVLARDEADSLRKEILAAAQDDYTARPYEPGGVGTFTSCVAYVLQALLVLRTSGGHGVSDPECDAATGRAAVRLLELQQSGGGWSWGTASEEAVGCYTLFTTEAIDALRAYEESGIRPLTNPVSAAIERGLAALVRAQKDDGGWGFRTVSSRSDPVNTCYAIATLASANGPAANAAIATGLEFVRQFVGSGTIREGDWLVDHRIVLPDTPEASWPHFEDYGGAAALVQALLALEGDERALGTSGLLNLATAHLIASRDSDRGWPARYSTIYATSYMLCVLRAVFDRANRDEQERNSP